jgi:3-oxoadipate enol-lactonase
MRVMARVITKSFGAIGVEHSWRDELAPIVFLHGVGSVQRVWRPQLRHFAGVRRAVALAYPGYHESDMTYGWSRDDAASAMFEAMDELEIDAAHICGLSLGGVIAIAMQAAKPERCVSLILADTFAVHSDGQGIYERSLAASREMTMRQLAEARVEMLLAADFDPAVRREVVTTMSWIDPEAYRTGAAAVWLADQRDRARAIECPTLVLCGEEDRITPMALSEELAGMIGGSRIEMIPGAGHLSNLEQPLLFNDALDRFLREVEP